VRETGNDLIDTAPLDDRPCPPTAEEIDQRRASRLAGDRYRLGNDSCALCGCLAATSRTGLRRTVFLALRQGYFSSVK